MTTYFRQESSCAHCGGPSSHKVLGSTNAFGSSDLDLRPPEMQRSTMDAWLQQCPHCDYVAPEIADREGDTRLVGAPEYRAVLTDQRFPELARRFLAHALLTAADPASAGYARLRAAWACDDARLAGAAAECRAGAAECFVRLKPFSEDDRGATIGLVLADVLRRAERFEDADTECQELLARAHIQGLMRKVLDAQRRFIAQRDAAAHTVGEVAQAS